jgi:hypothetical protein
MTKAIIIGLSFLAIIPMGFLFIMLVPVAWFAVKALGVKG